MLLNALSVITGYLTGSVLWGVVIGRAVRGKDPRVSDNPGASGSFRQFGPVIGTAVAVLDLIKAPAALVIAQRLGASGTGMALTAVSSVAGHNWPLWFGFQGGGGLACIAGAMLYLATPEAIKAIVLVLAVAALFKFSPLNGRLPLSSIPAGAVVGLPYLTWLTASSGNDSAFLASGLSTVAIGLRGLQMLRRSRERATSR